MYNEQLEQLIDAALADGELTEKEKQILFKKAQAMGVDLDEFEMVLDARLVKLKKAEEEKAASSAPKSDKFGDVKKCPACLQIVQSYQGVCPECGYAFENIEANKFSKLLADKLLEIDEQYAKIKNQHLAEIDKNTPSTKGIGSLTQNAAQKKLEAENRLNKEHIKAKTQLIKLFSIPTTKSDLVEFISTLNVRMVDKSENIHITDAYSTKNKECIEKAKLLFRNDFTFNILIEEYDKANKEWKKQRRLKFMKQPILWAPILAIVGIFLLLLPAILLIHSDNKEEKESKVKLEQLQTLLKNGELESAVILYDEINNASARKAMYRYYIDNGLYDEADKYVNKGNEDYFSYMSEVVSILAKNKQKSEAKKFIKRKIVFYEKYNDEKEYGHTEWNTKVVEKKLNAIVDNY